MKKAKLITFSITTRVLVDADGTEEEQFDEAVKIARPKIVNNAKDVIMGDNVVEIDDDEECPYDPEFDKES